MTPQQAARWFKSRPRAVHMAIQRAEREHLEEANKEAKWLSRGRISARGLDLLGHPYSHRGAFTMPQDPAIINKRNGLFLRSWWMAQRWQRPNSLLSVLSNTAPHAGFLVGGTRYMIRRPIDTRIIDRTRAGRIGRHRYYVDKALTPREGS